MKLIETFECAQAEKYGDGTEKIIAQGTFKIKQELVRPLITFSDSENNKIEMDFRKIKMYSCRLSENPLNKKELIFLSKTYDFDLINNERRPDNLTTSLMKLNKLYDCPATLLFTEQNKKEYLMIIFQRWQHSFQPRGAGEDMQGEDITYVHGIWENPLLTDQIIEKIKNQ